MSRLVDETWNYEVKIHDSRASSAASCRHARLPRGEWLASRRFVRRAVAATWPARRRLGRRPFQTRFAAFSVSPRRRTARARLLVSPDNRAAVLPAELYCLSNIVIINDSYKTSLSTDRVISECSSLHVNDDDELVFLKHLCSCHRHVVVSTYDAFNTSTMSVSNNFYYALKNALKKKKLI